VSPSLRGILAVASTVAAAGGLACGCGGAGTDSRSGTSGERLRAPAVAFALAHAVNLRPADVLPLKPSRFLPEAENRNGVLADRLAHCGGAVYLVKEQEGIHSRFFSLGPVKRFTVLMSTVRVRTSAALARKNIAAAVSPAALACLASYAKSGYNPGAVRVTVSPLPSPVPGVPGSFAWRYVIHHLRSGMKAPFDAYSDQLGFAVGQAEVELLAGRRGSPLPAATERRLLALLYSRAKANVLP
jgi:hypothetical protein